jgi:hypothetical protein
MTRAKNVALGILTLAPILAVGLVFAGLQLSIAGASKTPTLAGIVSIAFPAALFVSVIMTIYWATDVWRRADMNSDRKVLWMVIVILGSAIGQFGYFFVEVWPERSLLDTVSQGAPSATTYPPTAPYQPPPPSAELPGGRIAHVVLWRLKESTEGAPKSENSAEMKRRLEALRTTVPRILRLDVGVNIEGSDAAWDVALYSEFANADDLAAYQAHPDHLKVAEWIATVREDRAVADYVLS